MRVHLLDPRGTLTADVVSDAVSLVDVAPVTRSTLELLTSLELGIVYDWARREYLCASDGGDADRRDRPSCLDLAVVVSSLMEIAAGGEDDRVVMSRFRERVSEIAQRRARARTGSMVSYPTSPVRMESIVSIGAPHARPALVPSSSLPMPEDAATDVSATIATNTDPLVSPGSSWTLDPSCPQYRIRIDFVMRLPPGLPPPNPTLEAVDAAALAMSGPPFYLLPGARVGYAVVRPKAPKAPGGRKKSRPATQGPARKRRRR